MLERLAAAGYLCVVATHDLAWLAEWADRLVVLDGGRAAADAALRMRPDADALGRCAHGREREVP